MTGYFHAVLEIVADRSPDELVGALLVALVVSLVMTGLYGLVRKKVNDPLILMCSLMIVVSVASMATSAGYLRHAAQRKRGNVPPGAAYQPVPAYGRGSQLARRIFEAADTNGDGKLSESEASKSAALFVQTLDPSGKGLVDEDTVRTAIRERLSLPPGTPAPFPPSQTVAADPRQ
jgi:hypothetical protein